MKIPYRERDYAYGAAMLELRAAIGLTQKVLANLLGVSRRAVGGWEAGYSYPKAEHLKKVIALAVKQQAFPVGNEEQEIRKLWKVAHQKVILNEHWLSALLGQSCSVESATYSSRSEEQVVETQVQIEAEVREAVVESLIYPTDWGRFALGSPFGEVLYPGQCVEILLAGHRIAGVIHAGAPSDYFQSADGMSCCGLCAGMRVIVS